MPHARRGGSEEDSPAAVSPASAAGLLSATARRVLTARQDCCLTLSE